MHIDSFLGRVAEIARRIDRAEAEALVDRLAAVRERGGRVFVLGVGGSAANAAHLVNDLRKLCDIEAYAPTDNVSELTARTNDEGFETVFAAYLRTSRANADDAVFVLSVGGGNAERKVSVNLIEGIEEARKRGLAILGIVGRDGGHARLRGDAVLLIPTVDPALVTPLVEAYQAVIWHGLVSHPKLQLAPTKW